MTTYRLGSRMGTFGSGCVLLCFGLFVASFLGVFAYNQGGVEGVGTFALGLAVGGVVLWMAWAGARNIVAISFRNDGVVELKRGIGSTRVSAREIRFLQGEWVNDTYNRTKAWQMTIGHAEGRDYVGQFDGLREFVEQVRLYNLRVEIAGIWPLGLEPGIRRHPGDPAPARATRR